MARYVSAQEANLMVQAGEAVLVDVRETDEYATLHIEGTLLQPLSVLRSLPPDCEAAKAAIYFCNSGRRTSASTSVLDERRPENAFILEGGIEAWQRAGLPVIQGTGPLPIMRQVHIAAGSLIVIFLLIGQSVPFFRLFAVFIGLGFLASGLTGTCGMSIILKKMPWNKKR